MWLNCIHHMPNMNKAEDRIAYKHQTSAGAKKEAVLVGQINGSTAAKAGKQRATPTPRMTQPQAASVHALVIAMRHHWLLFSREG